MLYESPCSVCKNFMKTIETGDKGFKFICKAFPDGIPDDIIDGKLDHKTVLPDQKGKYVFQDKFSN